MGYRKVYFRIDSAYRWGDGWTDSNMRTQFKEESRRLFQNDGWTLEIGRSFSTCDTVLKGHQDLYLHPMNFSGVILEEAIPHLEEILTQAQSFHCRGVDCYRPYLDLDDEAYWTLLESKREEITEAILKQCQSKRRNLYVVGTVPEIVAQQFTVSRLCDKPGRKDIAGYYVRQLMSQLVTDGRLMTAKTKHGDGWRTATEKELRHKAAGNVLNGQQMIERSDPF